MYRAEDEKRADTTLGGAVHFLLKKVWRLTLRLRLQKMLMTEKYDGYRKATFSAIREAEAVLIRQ